MATIKVSFLEGQSIDRPPMLNSSYFSMWKHRMEIFLQSIDIELWYIVHEGPYETIVKDETTQRPRPKTRNELTALDRTHLSLNVKAMNILCNALDGYESMRIKGCKSAKEIWDTLCYSYEGSQDIREQKKSMLVSQYESFKIFPYENIDDMYCRFIDIIKELE